MNFQILAETIQQMHLALFNESVKAVNRNLTLRNWLIGYYIVEYEQAGEDRATYGAKLLTSLTKRLSIKGISETSLKLCRQFYQVYPGIAELFKDNVSTGLHSLISLPIRPTLTDELTSGPDDAAAPVLAAAKLVSRLSFSHLCELFPIKEPLKRAFYELECIKGSWSVKELKRQIGSLYYERLLLSNEPEKMEQYVQNQTGRQSQPEELIKDHHFFEFLGIAGKSLIEEADLEQALLDHLQDFIIELGNGFCFEARQKRILIGDEYFYVDMVFYHRILKCHVLIELKVEPFSHGNISQLNTYVNYFKKEIMQPDDNPPVGILMITNKNSALVEYATAGLDNKLFVSKYQLQLPSKEQLTDFVKKELQNL
ncbi:MAG: PDDEXK nuclease domain-containing protein [Janthinobacterium lividum]